MVGKKHKKINIYSTIINDVTVNMTSEDECNNFIALPGASLLNQYKNIEHKQTRENPVPEELKSGVD